MAFWRRPRLGIIETIILHWVVYFLAVILDARLFPRDISYVHWTAVAFFAIVLGILNILLKPLLKLLTLPLNFLTLGIFTVVINAFLFWLASVLSAGIAVTLLGAFIGAITVSILYIILTAVLRRL